MKKVILGLMLVTATLAFSKNVGAEVTRHPKLIERSSVVQKGLVNKMGKRFAEMNIPSKKQKNPGLMAGKAAVNRVNKKIAAKNLINRAGKRFVG